MKSHVAAVAMIGFVSSQALGATVCGGSGSTATAADITSLLTNRWACVTGQWNELHQGGVVTDWKQGPTDPVDPSEQVATYTITAGTAGNYDTITYNYGTGGTYSYAITPKGQTTTGTYTFCNVSTGATIIVNVSASHC